MAYAESQPTEPVEDTKDTGSADKRTVKTWWREIERYNRAAMKWEESADKIVKIYLAEDREESSKRRFSLLWSNIETLKPAVYAKIPQIIVSRRHKDPDPKARTASELMERAANTTFDLYGVDEVLRMVRDDRLLTARGQAWVRYEADMEGVPASDEAEAYERVTGERVCCDYVHYKDFGHNVARTWKDVWIVWRKVYKDRDEVKERWGKETADKLKYLSRDPTDDQGETNKAIIYECWDKKAGKVGWISKDCPGPLEIGDPPLDFRKFFPCPEPCYGTKTSRSLFPKPDYKYYQDQAEEIDDLTEKIGALTDWLIVKGFISAGPSAEGGDSLRTMLDTLQANVQGQGIFVPVEDWAAFQARGGAGKVIDWLPIDMIVQTLQTAIEARNQLIQDVYQITGISDILRGETDPGETLGAQKLKAETGSRRIKTARDSIATFAKELGELVVEVQAEQFQPQTLADMTGMQYVPPQPTNVLPFPGQPQQQPMQPMPPQQMGQQPMGQPPMQPQQQAMPQQPGAAIMSFDDGVIELLRNDRMRGFRIDIETDSTIQPDESADQERAVQFLDGLSTALERAAKILPAAPQLAPVVAEGVKFMSRKFRAGRMLEDTIERTLDQFVQQTMAPKQPQPDPELMKAQQELQIERERNQMDMQVSQQKNAADMQRMQAEMQMAQQRHQAEMQMMMEKHQAEMAVKQQTAAIDMETKRITAQQDIETRRATAAQDLEARDAKAKADAKARASKAKEAA